ncbi:hypothetical protein [Niallia sp.]|uniref:hypothetical protein n=1 Tax=Niallia sp. TaxID=2837523 RepID=UPI002896C8A9|nr:hypothetical protein [Niallia sp.]
MDDYKNEINKEKDSDHITEKEQTEVDHFSMFMFGTNHRSIRKEQVEHIQLNEEVSSNNRKVKGDAWILGRGNDNATKHIEEKEEENTNFEAIANFLNQVDLELLMKNVDLFMTSANDLKPIFKKITPFIKKWMD